MSVVVKFLQKPVLKTLLKKQSQKAYLSKNSAIVLPNSNTLYSNTTKVSTPLAKKILHLLIIIY